MKAICIIDTSVFCNILDVPNRNQQREEAQKQLQEFLITGVTLLLPMTTVYETGNHIAQLNNGQVRRQKALQFVEQARLALEGKAPWTPTPMPEGREMLSWLDQFPDSAMQGIGFGDLAITQIFKRTCQLNQGRRVFIWSYDGELQVYDRPALI